MKIIKIKNKNNRYMIFFPGWAFDYKIFTDLNFQYNIISYDKIDLLNYKNILIEYITKKNINELYLTGWSMGNFLLADSIEALSKIITLKKLYLISPTYKFKKKEVEDLKKSIIEDKINGMKKFYRKVFIGDKNLYNLFKDKYENYYLKLYTKNELLTTLNYLKNKILNIKAFLRFPVILIASKNDILIPFNEILRLKNNLKEVRSFFVDYTHTPFFYPPIKGVINEG